MVHTHKQLEICNSSTPAMDGDWSIYFCTEDMAWEFLLEDQYARKRMLCNVGEGLDRGPIFVT